MIANDETPPRQPQNGGPIEEAPWPLHGDLSEDKVTQWYRPSWRDGLRHVGYRWIYLTPTLALVLLGIAVLYAPSAFGAFLGIGFKLITLLIGVAAWLAGYVIRQAVQGRKEPFCIFCGYNLTGLPDNHRCPECGRPYTWAMIDEYRRDPQWFIERWKARRELPAASEPFEAGPVARRKRARDGTE